MMAFLRLVLPALAWLVVVIALATEVGIRTDVIGSAAIDAFVDVPQAELLHAEVLAFYYADAALPAAHWSERERAHLADVRAVLDAIRMAGLIAVLVAFVSLFDRQQRWWSMRRGAAVLLAITSVLGLLASEWSLFSRGMHPVLFPQGNWDFLPGEHVLIDLYSQPVLASYAAGILVVALVLAGLVWGIGRWGSGQGLQIAWHWRPGQRWLLLLAPAPVICAVLGYGMRSQGDAGYLLYWLLALLLLITVVLVFLRREKAWPGLLLGVLLICLLGQVAGLGLAVRQAKATTTTQGAVLVRALEAFRDRYGHLPISLQELGEDIPPVSGGGAWYYRRRGRHFVLGFDGPLDFAHEYVSWRGSWNTLNWVGWP